VGRGEVRLHFTVKPGQALGGLDYHHHFAPWGFAFTQGWGGVTNGKADYGANAGVGFRW
jgi:hypothetical protein